MTVLLHSRIRLNCFSEGPPILCAPSGTSPSYFTVFVGIYVHLLTSNVDTSSSLHPLNCFTIWISPFRKVILCWVPNIASAWWLRNYVLIISSTTIRSSIINVTRYSVFKNRTVSQTLSLNYNGRPFTSLSLGCSTISSIFSSHVVGSADRLMILKPAPVSK